MSKLGTVTKILLFIAALAALAALVVQQRHRLLMASLGSGEPPPLLEPFDEGEKDNPNLRWFDDYFLIVEIDAQTFAIAEPRYEQQNLNYLIIGRDRALLFDAGSGYRDVTAVASQLTDRPITFVPSHLHYDHLGNLSGANLNNGGNVARYALIDLPHLRERAPNNQLLLRWQEHLGAGEGYDTPTLHIDEWLLPNSVISLGGRALRILYTPGHTNDSISLYDRARGQLFSGDFIYQGPLYAFLPNSSLAEYAQGAETLLRSLPEDSRVYGAHRSTPPGLPVLSRSDINDLHVALQNIEAGTLTGTGNYPISYRVNEQIQLLAEPELLRTDALSYPEL